MKVNMKTYNFATKPEKNNPFLKIEIDNLSFIKKETLKKIDDKIDYTNNRIIYRRHINQIKKTIE